MNSNFRNGFEKIASVNYSIRGSDLGQSRRGSAFATPVASVRPKPTLTTQPQNKASVKTPNMEINT